MLRIAGYFVLYIILVWHFGFFLDVVRNAANKFAVAVGGDAAQVDDGIEYFDLDTAGDVVADVDPEVVRELAAR